MLVAAVVAAYTFRLMNLTAKVSWTAPEEMVSIVSTEVVVDPVEEQLSTMVSTTLLV